MKRKLVLTRKQIEQTLREYPIICSTYGCLGELILDPEDVEVATCCRCGARYLLKPIFRWSWMWLSQ